LEDTEWNDILRQKGILPAKEKVPEENREEEDQTEKRPEDIDDDDLDALLDGEDEYLEQYAQQRLAQMKAKANDRAARAKYGDVRDINRSEWVEQVNKAGEDVWVIIHLYKDSIVQCKLINMHLTALAKKFPCTKFLKSVATVCIENYPDKNLPTIFIYRNGDMKAQMIGPRVFRAEVTCDELEWIFKEVGAVESDMESDPRKHTQDAIQRNMNRIGAAYNNSQS